MAKLSTDELLDAFKEMTLIELSEFVKQFEDTFGVTAAAPVAVAAAREREPDFEAIRFVFLDERLRDFFAAVF
jgi:ribosomal protein L7/L12